MQPHKIVARITLLILSVVNFVLAAPVSVRLIREMRGDVVNVAEDVTTASQRPWNPSDKWWTDAALADEANTLRSLGSSDSYYRLEQELRPHDPRSPMDSNASPQPSPGSPDTDNSPPLQVDPQPPAHNDFPLNNDLLINTSPQPTRSQELKAGSDSGSHSTGSMSPWSWYERWVVSKSPSSSPSHDQLPPATLSDPVPSGSYSPLDSKLTESDPGLSRPYSPSDSTWTHPSSDSGQPTRARPPSDPGPDWPYSSLDSKLTESDPGPSRRPFYPLDSGQSSSVHLSSNSEQSTSAQSPSDSGQSKSAHSPSDSGQSTPAQSPSDFRQSTSAQSPSDSRQSTSAHPPPSPEPQQHESENFINELFRGRSERRISSPRSVNAA